MRVFRYIIFTVWALLALNSFSIQPQISSDQPIEFDGNTKTMVARGEATFVHENLTVVADEIRYDQNKRIAEAHGNVRVTYGNIRHVSEDLVYDVLERRLKSGPFRMGSPPYYAVGEGLDGTAKQINLLDTRVYFQEPSPLALNLQAKEVRFFPDQRIEADNPTFGLGDAPIFRLPSFSQERGQKYIQLKGRVGYQGHLGAYVKNSPLIPVSKNLSVGLGFDAYTERGILLGPAYAWQINPLKNGGISRFQSGYIDDSGNPGLDSQGNIIDNDRYFFDFQHLQPIGNRFQLSANVMAWSDSEVMRDFRPEEYHDNQQPDNYVEAVYEGKNFFVSSFARFSPNDFQMQHERLPEIRLDVMPTPLFNTGLYYSFNASAVRLEEHSIVGNPTLESDRYDAFYSIYRPLKVNKWLNIMPIGGARFTHYESTLNSNDSYSRVIGELGLDAEVSSYATWDFQNPLWGIDGLRHVFKPVLQYRYLPGGDSGKNKIIPIDRNYFGTSLPSIDLGNTRHLDEMTDLNVLRVGLENLLQTRHHGYGSQDLISFNIYQDLLLSAESGADEWTGLYTQLQMNPVHWMRIDIYNRISTESFTVQDWRNRITIHDSNFWSVSFFSDHLQNEINQYGFDYYQRINRTFGFRARMLFDTRRNDVTEQRYILHQRLGNAWEVEYQLAFYSGNVREDNTSFKIRFNLLQF